MFDDLRQQLQNKGSVTFTVRVRPDAKRTAAKEVMTDGSVKIEVAAKADGGKANRAVLDFLCGVFGVAPGSAELLTGQTSRQKRVRVSLPGTVLHSGRGKRRSRAKTS